jgi:TonB family protein
MPKVVPGPCRVRCVVAVVLAAVGIGPGRIVTGQDGLASVLALPMSPGAIARLVEYPQSDAARARLSRAMLDASPEIRAAAARVVFVTASVALLPQVASALGRETDADALVEQVRALTWFGRPEQDAQILDALERGSSYQAVLVFAAARGPSALSVLRRTAGRSADEMLTSDFVRIAMRGDAAAIAEMGGQAVRDGNRELLSAALRAVRDVDGSIPPVLMAEALRAPAESGLGLVALWNWLGDWPIEAPVHPGMIRDAIATFLDRSKPDAADGAAVLAHELAARSIGRSPRTDDGWATFLGTRSTSVDPYIGFRSLRVLLTDAEFERLTVANQRDPKAFTPLRHPSEMAIMKASFSARQTAGLFVASGYPRGFVRSVFSVAGCNPRGFNAGGGAAADLVMRSDGRVARISLIESDVRRECAAAARTLFMTYVADPFRPVKEGDTGLIIVPFVPDYITCQDSRPTRHAQRSSPGDTVPPKKIRNVQPKYPADMQVRGISGVVVMEAIISTTGCIRSARIVQSVHPRMDWAAISAVIGWRFTPSRQNGEPVDTRVMVTVQFLLQ